LKVLFPHRLSTRLQESFALFALSTIHQEYSILKNTEIDGRRLVKNIGSTGAIKILGGKVAIT